VEITGSHDRRLAGTVAVAIMAKAPEAGAVKTRLCPPLSAAEAAALARCFLLDRVAQVRTLAGVRAAVGFTPARARGAFAALAPGFRLVAQRGTGLGERVLGVIATLLGDGHPAVVVTDADTPTLPAARLQEAVDRLAAPGPDVVLGPTEDGGYYLIGMRAAHAALFADIPWSTPAVLAATLERARAAGLATACLAPWFDVDTPDDLARLRADLAALGAAAPAHTSRFLRAL
jgi:rSAM/selenodomain-associated transferase 1